MSLNKASIAVALAAFLAVGGIAGQALAAPHDGHDGHWRQQRSYQDCIYQALTQEKKEQYDAIMKEFADKTAPLRDKLAAKYIELRTLGNSPTPDPKAIGKATEELVALRNEFAKERSAMVDRVAKEIGINIFQGKALGRPADCINIHTVDARADDAAQARGTELQIHIEPLFDLIFIVCDGPQLIFRILVEIRVRKPLFIDLHVIFHVLFHSLNLSFCPQNQSCLMVPLYFIYLKKESIK